MAATVARLREAGLELGDDGLGAKVRGFLDVALQRARMTPPRCRSCFPGPLDHRLWLVGGRRPGTHSGLLPETLCHRLWL